MVETGKGIGSMSDVPVGAGGAVFNSDAVTVAPRACFFCCARKSRQKEALGDAPYCALTRANFWPLRGLNALSGANSQPSR